MTTLLLESRWCCFGTRALLLEAVLRLSGDGGLAARWRRSAFLAAAFGLP